MDSLVVFTERERERWAEGAGREGGETRGGGIIHIFMNFPVFTLSETLLPLANQYDKPGFI